MSKFITKTFINTGVTNFPTPVDVLCPIKANIIESCTSDNKITLFSGSTHFNKNIRLKKRITLYDNESVVGKILSGSTNGFELVNFPLSQLNGSYITGGTYSNGVLSLIDNHGGVVSINGLYNDNIIFISGNTLNNELIFINNNNSILNINLDNYSNYLKSSLKFNKVINSSTFNISINHNEHNIDLVNNVSVFNPYNEKVGVQIINNNDNITVLSNIDLINHKIIIN